MIIGVIIIIILYLFLLIIKIHDGIQSKKKQEKIMSHGRQEIISNDRKKTTENFKMNWVSMKE
jgi:hypothetical protein